MGQPSRQERDLHKMTNSIADVGTQLRAMNTYLAAINQNLVIIGALMAEAGKDETKQEQEHDDASED